MAAPYAVPLTRIPLLPARNQSLTVDLNGTDYRMRVLLNDVAQDPFWALDIGDAYGVPILCGIPLLGGQNLLDQYGHLSIGGGGALFCAGPNIPVDPLPIDEMGTGWFLYFAPPTNAPSTLDGLAFVPPAFAGPRLG